MKLTQLYNHCHARAYVTVHGWVQTLQGQCASKGLGGPGCMIGDVVPLRIRCSVIQGLPYCNKMLLCLSKCGPTTSRVKTCLEPPDI